MSDLLKERFESLRAREFGRLDEGRHVYLDYTGSGLYALSQLRALEDLLGHEVLGNPHSESPTSAHATEMVEAARRDPMAPWTSARRRNPRVNWMPRGST